MMSSWNAPAANGSLRLRAFQAQLNSYHKGPRASLCRARQAQSNGGAAEQAPSADVVSRRQLQALVAAALVPMVAPLHSLAASPPRTVFVAGATGATGKRVVKALRARGVNVVAGVRESGLKKVDALGWTGDAGIRVVVADVTKSPKVLAEAMKGADAVICTTGGGAVTPFDNRAKTVDNQGTRNLVDAAKLAGVGTFVLMSSLLTNAVAVGQASNPNYVVLQLFGGVLEEKLKAEKYLRASGLRWTIVRPGGLSDKEPAEVGNLFVSGEDTLFGLDGEPGREISRQTVADMCVEALFQDQAADRVFEIVASPAAPANPPSSWFSI